MKMKNVSVIEQHIEKIVLAIAILFALVVLWRYYLTPYTAEVGVGGGEQADWREVDQMVKQKARTLETKLNSDATVLPEVDVHPYTSLFRNRLAEPPIALTELPMPFSDPGVEVDIRPPEIPTYWVATPPPPQDVVVSAGYNVLLPAESLQRELAEIFSQQDLRAPRERAVFAAEQYAELVGEQTPRDFQYVSVAAEFDWQTWFDVMKEVPAVMEGQPPEAVPDGWLRSTMLVLDVVLERQTKDPRTGQWMDSIEIIQPLPHQMSYRSVLDKDNWLANEAEQMRQAIRMDQERIREPRFAPTTGRRPWLPPGTEEQDLTMEQQRELRSLYEKVQDLQDRKRKLQKRSSRPDAGGAARGREGPDDRVPGRTPSRAGTGTLDAGARDRINSINTEIAEAQQRIREIRGIKTAAPTGQDPSMMDDPYGPMGTQNRDFATRDTRNTRNTRPGRPDLSGGFRDGGFEADGGTDAAADQPRFKPAPLLAHDLTVDPDKVYRYRVRVRVGNPLFLQSRLKPEQKDLAKKIALLSKPSEWSDPVSTRPRQQFFVVSARPRNKTATVEIWSIFNGEPMQKSFVVGPGERIGREVNLVINGQSTDLNLETDYVMVDALSIGGSRTGLPENNKALLLNLDTNALAERLVAEDANSDERTRLLNDRMLLETDSPTDEEVMPADMFRTGMAP